MIKAKMNDGTIVFGLSRQNVQLLKEGKPIRINLKEMGLEEREILIVYGNSEDDIFKEMLPFIDLNKTKIHLP
jgi:hypothetical protein